MAQSKIQILLEAQDRASKKLDNIEKSMKKMSGTSAKAGAAFKRLGQIMVSAGIAKIMQGIVMSAVNFEDAFAGVRKTVDATEKEFGQLRKGLLNMSKEIPVSVEELAKIQEVAGQLGIRGVDSLTKFTKTMAMLSSTTNIAGESGTLQLSRFMGVMSVADDDVDRLGSSLAQLGNEFKTQEAELLALSQNLASFGVRIGLSADQVLAFGTAIISSGGEAQAASTAFQKVAIKIRDATITGSKDLTTLANIAGTTRDEFVQVFEKDSAQAIVLFLKGLKKIEDQGGTTTTILKELGLADQRLAREFGKVITQIETLEDALDQSSTAFKENTALVEEFRKKQGTTASQIKLTKNNINVLSIALGERLLPALENVLISTNYVVDAMQRLADATMMVGMESNDLQSDLERRIKSYDWEIEKQKETIRLALANPGARAKAEERIIVLLEDKKRAMQTLLKLHREEQALTETGLPEGGIGFGEGGEEGIFGEDDATTKLEEEQARKLESIGFFQDNISSMGDEALAKEITRLEIEFNAKKVTEEQKTKIILEEEKKRQKTTDKIAKEKLVLEKKINDGLLSSTKSFLSASSDEHKAFAIALKAIRIAEVIMNTQATLSLISKHWVPPTDIPWKIKAIAEGAMQVATIAATGFQKGTDSVPAQLTPGEMVIPNTFADAIRDGRLTLSGGEGGGGVTINIIEPQIGGGGDSVEDFAEELGFEVERALKTARGF